MCVCGEERCVCVCVGGWVGQSQFGGSAWRVGLEGGAWRVLARDAVEACLSDT